MVEVFEGRAGVEAPPNAPPRNRMVVALLALLGLLVSLYLLSHALGWAGPVVCGVGDCEAVQTSPHAWIGPVPVSAVGAVGYGSLLVVALVGLQPAFAHSRLVSFLLLGGSALGVLFSAYLTYLEAFVIGAWCQWCVTSAILITLALFASFPEARRMGGRT